jgi:hypothetical protein
VYTDSFNTLNLDGIPIRSDLIILVTSITDDCFNRFYGQILNLDQPSSAWNCYIIIMLVVLNCLLKFSGVHLGTLEKLEQLMVKLAQDSKLIRLQLLPALGQLLVVQHYGSFYRGRVIEIVEDASSSGVLVMIGSTPLKYFSIELKNPFCL